MPLILYVQNLPEAGINTYPRSVDNQQIIKVRFLLNLRGQPQ